MTKPNAIKTAELSEVGLAYIELKGLYDRLMAQKRLEVEEEVAQARHDFGVLVQSKVDREGYPYKITVADLARAMNTTNRGTVYEYLKDARERAKNRFANALNPVLPYEIYGVWNQIQGNPARTTTWAIVFDGENTWDVTLDGNRFHIFEAVPDDSTMEGYKRNGGEKKWVHKSLDNDAPEWLTWLIEQDEWQAKL